MGHKGQLPQLTVVLTPMSEPAGSLTASQTEELSQAGFGFVYLQFHSFVHSLSPVLNSLSYKDSAATMCQFHSRYETTDQRRQKSFMSL